MKKLWLIRKDREAVSPVIATILMVAITVVLAAVLYVMVSGLLGGGGGATRPYVTFGSVVPGGSGTNLTEYWTIADSNPPNAYSAYKVQVLKDGSPLSTTATTVTQNTWMTFGTTVKVKVTDVGGEGKLTGGDRIDVIGMTSGSTYVLSLIWGADGAELQKQTWTI